MAYVPGHVVSRIQNATTATLNFSDPQYGHRFDVDAPPGTGDLFYGGLWHTWLVGGLGPGGKAIYALDVTDPDSYFTSEGNAGTVVKGEWDSTNLSCIGNGGCKNSLGNTYGVPVIRRFHNGNWGAIFGNGYGSASGDAGIFVMLVSSTGSITFYYLSTGVGSANGIGYVASADLDGDHITDYVYGGDLQGNMWRFDLTDTNPANWAVVANPIFTTPSGQPITTAPIVLAAPGAGTFPHVLVEFGTGRQVPMTNTAAANYQTTAQAIYGIWDWNLSSWNSLSSVKYATKPTSALPSSPNGAVSGTASLQAQTITSVSAATVANSGSDFRTVSANPVCYADATGCTQYGWYLTLTSGHAYPTDPAVPQTSTSFPTSPTVYEQIIFSPTLIQGAFVINTTIPPATSATSCFNATASGWTMAMDPVTGGAFTTAFFLDSNANSINTPNGPATGIAIGATGTVSSLIAGGGQSYILTQTGGSVPPSSAGSTGSTGTGTTGTGFLGKNASPGAVSGKRLTWIQKR
jgi:type IV pilus assembly protein PilY1